MLFVFQVILIVALKSFFFSVLAEDAIKAALSDYRLKQQDKEEHVKASN